MVPIVKDTRFQKEMGIAFHAGFRLPRPIYEIRFGFFAQCVM
jgi:hypothetical protein